MLQVGGVGRCGELKEEEDQGVCLRRTCRGWSQGSVLGPKARSLWVEKFAGLPLTARVENSLKRLDCELGRETWGSVKEGFKRETRGLGKTRMDESGRRGKGGKEEEPPSARKILLEERRVWAGNRSQVERTDWVQAVWVRGWEVGG